MKKLIYVLLFISCNCIQAQETYTEYHDNGKIALQASKINGKFEGQYSTYYKEGNLKTLERYSSSFVIQKKEYYKTGELSSTMYFIDGTDAFKVYYYYKNGQLKKEGKLHRNGTKLGEWLHYSEDNELIKTVNH